MTYSLSDETRFFWRSAQIIHAAQRDGLHSPAAVVAFGEAIDDLELLQCKTASATLRNKCSALVGSADNIDMAHIDRVLP